MAKNKYYAVKKGRVTGIFEKWQDCKNQIDGYSGAEYKAFLNYQDAKNYLGENFDDKPQNMKKEDSVIAYVDGSYSKEKNKYSYGCIILCENEIIKFGGVNDSNNYIEMKNIAGEILGAIESVKWAINNNYSSITIYYDYLGIEKWANYEWKTNKQGTIEYADFIKKSRRYIDIDFKKVQAHTGDFYNEEADKLAKQFLNQDIKEKKPYGIERYLDDFYQIMQHENKTKNRIYFKYNNYMISENKLKKFVKHVWVQEGNKKDDIDRIDLYFDLETWILEWKIKTKLGEYKSFILNIKER